MSGAEDAASKGTFVNALFDTREDQSHGVFERDDLAAAIRSYLEAHRFFEGTARELLVLLRSSWADETGLPKTPELFASRLKRLIPVLRDVGIHHTNLPRSRHARPFRLELSPLSHFEGAGSKRRDGLGDSPPESGAPTLELSRELSPAISNLNGAELASRDSGDSWADGLTDEEALEL